MEDVPLIEKDGVIQEKAGKSTSKFLVRTGLIGIIVAILAWALPGLLGESMLLAFMACGYSIGMIKILAIFCNGKLILAAPLLLIGTFPNIIGSLLSLIKKNKLTDIEKILFYINVGIVIFIIWGA